MTEKEQKEIQAQVEKLSTAYIKARLEEAQLAHNVALEALDKYESYKKAHDSYISSGAETYIAANRATVKQARDAFIEAYQEAREADKDFKNLRGGFKPLP